jgi:polyhydroxybutyrate depolymerase
MKKYFLITVFNLLALYVCAADLDKRLTVDGLERKYLIHLPTGYNAGERFSIIFALHGGGGSYLGTPALYNLNPLADKSNFIVVYPDAINKSWSMKGISSKVKGNSQDIDDVHFISVLIDTIATYYKGDAHRIFCTGLSRGGIFSLFLASRLSQRIKAIAPVCASIPQSIVNDYRFTHPTPVLLINGTADPLISYTGGPGKFGKAAGNEEQYDMLPTEELIAKITTFNNCKSPPEVYNLPDANTTDGCTAIQYTYNCNNVQVKFIKIINGGHTWAGGKQYLPRFIIGRVCLDFKAEEQIINFFMAAK